MGIGVSIANILKRIGKSVERPDKDISQYPRQGFEDRLETIIQTISETVRPRTLTFLADDIYLVAKVTDGKLVAAATGKELDQLASPLAPSESDLSAELAWILIDFASREGELTIASAPFGEDSGPGVPVSELRTAIAALAPTIREEASARKPSGTSKAKNGGSSKRAKGKSKSKATKAGRAKNADSVKPLDLAATNEVVQDAALALSKFAETVILVSHDGDQNRLHGEWLGERTDNLGKLVDDLTAWRSATSGAIGADTMLVLRSEGLDGRSLCLLPEDGFVLVAIVENRHLSRIFAFERERKRSGQK